MKPDISVVVPLRNEAPNVLTLADRIFRAIDNGQRVVELIFVDDGSTDETWIRVLEAKNLDSRVRALRHSRNAGQSAALWTGFKACEAKVIATLDGDLQNDPADLPGMLAELENCDMVVVFERSGATILSAGSPAALHESPGNGSRGGFSRLGLQPPSLQIVRSCVT